MLRFSAARSWALALLLLATSAGVTNAAPLAGTSTVQRDRTGPPAGGPFWGTTSFAAAGDVNADGIDDLVASDGLVVLGVRPQQNLDVPAGSPRLRWLRPGNSVAISSVQAAGDVDGDGVDDLLAIGDAPYVVYGKAGFTDVTLRAGADVTVINTDYAPLDEQASAIGDFDGDGYDDLGTQRGTAFGAIARGGPRIPSITVTTPGARVIQVQPKQTCSFSWITWRVMCVYGGAAVVPAGDVNGDGKADILTGYSDTIVYGRAGTAAIQVGSVGSGGTVLRKPGGSAWGATQLEPRRAGDVNGDGYDDLLLNLWAPPASDRYASILLGGPALGAAVDVGAAATIDLRWPGSGARLDHLYPAGDHDGDGATDLVVVLNGDQLFRTMYVVTKLPSAGGSVVDVTTGALVAGLPSRYASPEVDPDGSDFDGDGALDLLVGDGGARADGLTYWDGARLVTSGPDRAAPQLVPAGKGALAIKPQAFKPGSGATQITAELVEAATVTVEWRAGATTLGSEQRALPAGVSTWTWDGAVNGQPLAAGNYTVRLTPRDAAGNVGGALSLPFTITEQPVGQTASYRVKFELSDPSGVVKPGYQLRIAADCEEGYFSAIASPNGPALDAPDERGVIGAADAACNVSLWPPMTDGLYGCASTSWSAEINGVATPVNFGYPTPFRSKAGVNTITVRLACGAAPAGLATFAEGWRRYGDVASWIGPRVSLTPTVKNTTAAIYSPQPIDPRGRVFTFAADLRGGPGGGEGLAMVFLDAAGGPPPGGFLGAGGAALGFGGLPGTAIALDTRQNPGDPSVNFLGLARGSASQPLQYVQTFDPGVRLRSGVIQVQVSTTGGRLQVSVNGRPRIDRPIADVPGLAYIGFTAANGDGGAQGHVVSGFTAR